MTNPNANPKLPWLRLTWS